MKLLRYGFQIILTQHSTFMKIDFEEYYVTKQKGQRRKLKPSSLPLINHRFR